jgi:hypothetical protein
MKCSHDPRELKGHPIGMYHCPECGEMVVAGIEHPNYDLIGEGPDLDSCPVCKKPNCFNPQIEEVDIGVGIQTLLVGGECKHCGWVAKCPTCGAFNDHEQWCDDLKKLREDV